VGELPWRATAGCQNDDLWLRLKCQEKEKEGWEEEADFGHLIGASERLDVEKGHLKTRSLPKPLALKFLNFFADMRPWWTKSFEYY